MAQPRCKDPTLLLLQGLNLDVKPNIMGVSLGGFISLASAAFYGEFIDSAIVIAGSAGSIHSPPPTDRAIWVLTSPTATPLMILGVYYPLQYRDGMWNNDLLAKCDWMCVRKANTPMLSSLTAAEAACKVYFDPDNVAPDIVNQTTFTRQTGAVLDFVRGWGKEWPAWNTVGAKIELCKDIFIAVLC